MPSFVIHLAVAKEYERKHKSEIKDIEQFEKGNIAPDITDNKYKSHYDNYAKKHEGLMPFLKQKDIDIFTDYGKGYFMHLLTDELFYHNTFEKEHKYIIENNLNFYNDYDCLNGKLLEKYKDINLPDELKKYTKIVNEKPRFLDYKRVQKFIDDISNIALEEQISEIKLKGNPKI